MTVAQDLAERMDFDSGQVRYCIEGMVARLGLSRATISRHVAYLRELGSLVWVERGSRANARRIQGLPGYAGTATVYGAVIPASYDHAYGHTVLGTGYTARIMIDQRGAAPAPARPVEAPGRPPVDNSGSGGLETPSRTWVEEDDQVQIVGGCNYTSRQRASRSKTRSPHQSTPCNGRRRTAADVRRAERTIRLVRALVSWTQPVALRRLEYVLRPLTDRGLDAHEIAAELTAMCSGMRWRPHRADAFISQRLSAVAAYDRQLAVEAEAARQAVAPMSNPEWAALVRRKQAREVEAVAARTRSDGDRAAARADWNVWPDVIAHMQDDQDDALDLYGLALCQFAIGQQDRLERRESFL